MFETSYSRVVQVGALKKYICRLAAPVEVLRKRKEGQDETQFTTKIDGLPSFNPR
jgi:hypothetical protein